MSGLNLRKQMKENSSYGMMNDLSEAQVNQIIKETCGGNEE